jgi:hypothetical protein
VEERRENIPEGPGEDLSESKDNGVEDKTLVTCPNEECGRVLRIPRSRNALQVLCPVCGSSFVVRSSLRSPSWILNRVKAHPVFLGLLVTAWSFMVLGPLVNGTIHPLLSIPVTLGFFVVWIIGTLILDLLREEGVKWYHRKWVVVLSLIILAPVGIALLWSGSRFRRSIKVGLTVVACSWFLFNIFREVPPLIIEPDSSKVQVISLLQSQKGVIHLNPASKERIAELHEQILSIKGVPSLKPIEIPEIARRFGESVVLVRSMGRRGRQIGLGSGFIIGWNGAVATNFHVIAGARKVTIELVDGRTYDEITLIASNPTKDLAVLQIDTDDPEGDPLPVGDQSAGKGGFIPVVLGDSHGLEVGERVVAIGNPYSWENTLSDGLISGIRDLEGTTLLQITAPISPGSSGGALFNMRGEVIGITTIGSTWGAQNLNFAVPSNSLRDLILKRQQEAL